MEHIIKYPRTRHIEGSRLQTGDEDLKNIRFETIKDTYVVLEEKVDGANCGISFDKNGKLFLQSRGHYLTGGYGERQFDLFKLWANCFSARLYELLGSRYIMYGEWLYAKHTVFYDSLTHYFMEFDIYDRERQVFLSTGARQQLLEDYPFIVSVRVLYEGTLSNLEELKSYLGKSQFKTSQSDAVLKYQCETAGVSYEITRKQTDETDLMEGIYIKVEDNDTGVVTERMKYVRSSFLNTILDSETHWADRPMIPNCLGNGIDIFSAAREEG